MEIIYGNLEYVPSKQIDKLWNKAVDKMGRLASCTAYS